MENMAVKTRPTFPAVIISRDDNLAVWLDNTAIAVEIALKTAYDLTITDDDSMSLAVNLKREFRESERSTSDIIKPYKQRLDEVKKQIIDTEKDLAGGFKKASDIVMQKINDRVDFLEQERKKEERRLLEMAEKEKQKRLDAINASLDKLLDKENQLLAQKQILEEHLKNQSLTVEEAEIIRSRIESIEKRIDVTSQRIETKQTSMNEVSEPLIISVNNFEKPKGMSTRSVWKLVEVSNPKATLKGIIDGIVPLGCVAFSSSKLERLANDQVSGTNQAPNVPGCRFEAIRDTRIR